ncbi:MAG: BREX-1 system adenine-specific DNA-methyltransferase PglX, partial [Lachnospiraceae bacterium]|nr:BREX-1 system adenine-specific DNA-methyltransferase PglX [Lachnospiraceae bacterium]
MDKNAIKRFAVWARRELISRVSQKALHYGITDKEILSADAGSIEGTVLSDTEKKQRKALVEQ